MTEGRDKDEVYILLVEDDRDDFFLTQDLLERVEARKYRLVWSASCDSAMQELRERRFDAVLVDYRIGERTGLDFIKEVGPQYTSTPMILLTGLRSTDIDLAAQAAGAADYLVKDSLTEELLDRSIRYACQQVQRSALLDSVLSNAAAGMVALDATGAPIIWNKQALRALDLNIARLSGVNRVDVAGAFARLAPKGQLPDEFNNAESQAFELTANAVPGGGKIVVFHDITRRARAEQLLRQAVNDAEAANRAKSSFLATMSHELRTPLNGILGMVRVLQGTEVDEAQNEYLSTIKSSGDNLLRLINDILDLSKIEAGRMEIESIDVDIPNLVGEVVKTLAANALHRGIEIAAYVDPKLTRQMRGDPLRLKQVLLNLAGNAIKFTSTGSVIIAITADTTSGRNRIRFSVTDTGIGIPADKLEQLFKKFSQVDASTTRKYGGTGLGLALCRELVGLMQGEIWCESREGAGSTFAFALPATIGIELVAPAVPAEMQSVAGSRLLLVEHGTGSAAASVLGRYAKALGATLTILPTIEAARRAISAERFAAVLVDRRSKTVERDGLVRQLRDEAAAGSPVVLLLDDGSSNGTTEPGLFDETLLCPFVHGTFERLCQVLRERVRKQPARQVRAVAPAESRSLQVLMAEDNEPNQRVARALLRAAGYDIHIASDGAKAVEKANTHRYDVILMDLHMPVMDGLEATRSLRKQDNSRDVPIIGLTASAMKEDREKCLEAGMNDHLAKPVDWDHLIRLLGDLERKIYGVKAVA